MSAWSGATAIEAPLITALLEIKRGGRPTISETLRVGLAAFVPVAGVVILYTLGFTGGLILFVLPGVILGLRWLVAAQTVVVEGLGVWKPWRGAVTS